MQRRPQRIEPADLKRLTAALDKASEHWNFVRLRAIVTLAHVCALDLSDVLALDFRSALALRAPRRWTVQPGKHLTFLRGHKAPPVYLAKSAAPDLETWIRITARELRIQWPPPAGVPMFHQRKNGKLVKLSPRTVQAQFAALQHLAKTAAHYRFSDLRHDAIRTFAEHVRDDPAFVASFARVSERQALAYMPKAPAPSLADLDAGR